jgi:hypothetical protein
MGGDAFLLGGAGNQIPLEQEDMHNIGSLKFRKKEDGH